MQQHRSYLVTHVTNGLAIGSIVMRDSASVWLIEFDDLNNRRDSDMAWEAFNALNRAALLLITQTQLRQILLLRQQVCLDLRTVILEATNASLANVG